MFYCLEDAQGFRAEENTIISSSTTTLAPTTYPTSYVEASPSVLKVDHHENVAAVLTVGEPSSPPILSKKAQRETTIPLE